MTAILGAAACVLATACGIGFGWNLRAWTAGLQTRFDPVLTCGVYLLGVLACVVTVGVCLGAI